MSIMSLLLEPTGGEIFFHGKRVRHGEKFLKMFPDSMTMVIQNPYLFNMSVAKNVTYGLRVRKIAKEICERKVKDALALVGLADFEKRMARKLSGGETRLVALARALVLDPGILFLDESAANIDVRNIQRFEGIIKRINKQKGTTIFMTTHNLPQVHRITENVFSIFQGRLVSSTMHNLFSGKISMTNNGIFSITMGRN